MSSSVKWHRDDGPPIGVVWGFPHGLDSYRHCRTVQLHLPCGFCDCFIPFCSAALLSLANARSPDVSDRTEPSGSLKRGAASGDDAAALVGRDKKRVRVMVTDAHAVALGPDAEATTSGAPPPPCPLALPHSLTVLATTLLPLLLGLLQHPSRCADAVSQLTHPHTDVFRVLAMALSAGCSHGERTDMPACHDDDDGVSAAGSTSACECGHADAVGALFPTVAAILQLVARRGVAALGGVVDVLLVALGRHAKLAAGLREARVQLLQDAVVSSAGSSAGGSSGPAVSVGGSSAGGSGPTASGAPCEEKYPIVVLASLFASLERVPTESVERVRGLRRVELLPCCSAINVLCFVVSSLAPPPC